MNIPPQLTRILRVMLLLIAVACPIGAEELRLTTGGSGALQGSGSQGRSHQVEASGDLDVWSLVHAIRDQQSWAWSDEDASLFGRRYYRLQEKTPSAISPHSSWKTDLDLPGDAFLSDPVTGSGETEVRWVKFALVMDGLPTVYFQDSAAYPFHYQFATERLDPFVGLDLQEFNARSLFQTGREIVLGAVLWAPGLAEYGIQFVGQDEFPRETVRLLYDAVDGAIGKPAGATGFYMPTFEQAALARRELAYFAARGIVVSAADRWSVGDGCYSDGWALGRMVFVTATEIDAAYQAGDLLPGDILVTDGVPAEVPFVAGLISFTPTTPNSHVVILARSYGIPFAYVADETAQAAVMARVNSGGEVLFLSDGGDEFAACRQRIVDVGSVDPSFLDELRELKNAPELEIDAIAPLGSIVWSDLATALPDDIDHIGGKAANFGYLRREIPANSPEAIAFSFDLWESYLDQTIEGGGTLRAEIASRLAGHTWPADVAALSATLDGVRELIRKGADFSPAQRSQVIAALTAAGFDPDKKIRFRSSTNVEDGEHFVGAGLYDSFSGCLHDDTDADDLGPSHCDPDQPNERGVLRAMRKVYASFYNLNAYIERLRHGVDETQVGMALLVHHSFPDEIEAANGVVTGTLRGSESFWIFPTKMVSQVGANSVTNPDGGSLPEIVDVEVFRGGFGTDASLDHRQRSSLLQLGNDTVLDWRDDYVAFGTLFLDVAIAIDHPNQNYEIEFEYKKLTGGERVVKQVRRVPEPQQVAEFPALVNSPVTWKIFQGEHGSVFGNHRLKSVWQVETDSRWLDAPGLGTSFLSATELEWLPEGVPVSLSGPPSTWPSAAFELVDTPQRDQVRETWQLQTSAGLTDFELLIDVPSLEFDRGGPIFLPEDLAVIWNATYPTPQLEIQYDGTTTTATLASVRLTPGLPGDPPQPGSLMQRRTVTEPGASVTIEFYWPPAPTGIVAGYTAPLEAWEETTITGLTSEPIVLHGYYSQTYRPEHHNFSEHFLFEPALEPGISATTLNELQSQNIRYLYTHYSGGGPNDKIIAIGFDDSTWQIR